MRSETPIKKPGVRIDGRRISALTIRVTYPRRSYSGGLPRSEYISKPGGICLPDSETRSTPWLVEWVGCGVKSGDGLTRRSTKMEIMVCLISRRSYGRYCS